MRPQKPTEKTMRLALEAAERQMVETGCSGKYRDAIKKFIVSGYPDLEIIRYYKEQQTYIKEWGGI